MIVDPVEALKKTSNLLVPTSSKMAIPGLPTVLPTSSPIVVKAGDMGTSILWVVFVLMLISTIAFAAMAFRVPVQQRLFHILTAFITTFAAISYFAMATGDGNSYTHSVIIEKQQHVPDLKQDFYRQIFWARYVDWSLTTPLLLLDLAFLAGLNGAQILVTIIADVIMILTGLFAALSTNDGQKWGYYAMACIAFLVVIYQLAVHGRAMAHTKDSKTGNFFTAIGAFTLVLWTVYPIIWGIGEGSNTVNVDGEILAYAILDILAKPVFGFWLLFTHGRLDSTHYKLDGFWSHGLATEGSIRVGDDDEGA
ncbi:MAG: hypothetical protein M1812_006101 [Candelaria pacifica]|nr:MAG: hypothetical protein M1812_006101 [Candelaria pacifica]